ncbi:hypothetical protein KC887_05655 [Candidatus Kaiserbacteria bacterium]|nr:hypothetical protein [Candidatus Kaiserbacteria bacterium]
MTQKWNLQDIRPAGSKPSTRSVEQRPQKPKPIQNHNPAAEGRPRPVHAPAPDTTSEAPQFRENIPTVVIEDGRKNGKKRLLWAVMLFVVIVGGAVGLSAVLGKTELTIYPEFREPNISAEFTAYPQKRDGALSYEILTLDATGEKQVKASGQVTVTEQAKGTLTIKKNTPGPERLIKNTRFRSPDGKIFRIEESVVVPGAVNDSPGTIQAKVFADEAGEDYNLPAGTTFDVPGFEEGGYTALFEAISATNETAFSGGFDGPQFQIDENELSTAQQQLQIDLRNQLLEKVKTSQPADFVTFPDAIAITYNSLPAVEYGSDLVTIREQAVLQIPLFKRTDFGSFLAKEAVATYEGGPVRVDDPTALTFKYSSATTSASVLANQDSLTFNLSGKPLLIWEYDESKLTKDLAGLPKTALQNAITAYPGIKGARVRITPFWKRTFPQNADDIIVIEELKLPE